MTASATTASAENVAGFQKPWGMVWAYLSLTKPTIMFLVLFTGAAALVVEGSLLLRPGMFLLFLLGLFLTGGSANALNQYFERDLDALMSRTSGRRVLPLQKLPPVRALTFAVGIGMAGVLLLGLVFNWLTALLSLATILFYSLFYTLMLKPTTPQNIVIGGAAGAMAPVGAWAAATGDTGLVPWLMFAIIFLWTPPHFWALAIAYKGDYERTGLPMLPVVAGDETTLRWIFGYSVVLVLVTVIVPFFGPGPLYTTAAVLLGARFIQMAGRAWKRGDTPSVRALFGFSIIYLFGLFAALAIDALI